VYHLIGPLYPLLRRVFSRYVMITVNVGRAMIRVAIEGCATRILSSADINRLAGA
jgi:hypothetical protein